MWMDGWELAIFAVWLQEVKCDTPAESSVASVSSAGPASPVSCPNAVEKHSLVCQNDLAVAKTPHHTRLMKDKPNRGATQIKTLTHSLQP